MNRLNRGFTLIELLVVIAIIGILSSVVLASLNTARSKGADAAVKSNLNNIRAQAELYYDSNSNSYTGVCTAGSGTILAGVTAAANAGVAGSGVCNTSSTAWAASATLKQTNQAGASTGTDYWCVDSTGQSKVEDGALGAGTVCA
ncbi:MAG TPA: type II secretion system protein [Candidatus Paceibacterota bacterium]|nr:hypothetical protein [uncultured archaeon]